MSAGMPPSGPKQPPTGPASPTAGYGYPPAGPPQPPPPQRIILEQPTGRFRKLFMSLVLVALVISVLINFGLAGAYQSYAHPESGIIEQVRPHVGSASAREKIAIISVSGVMMEEDGFTKKQIDRAFYDDDVKAVVLRVDSPGGTVNAANYLFDSLKNLRDKRKIPLVVSMGSVAASGGYYISMAVGDAEKTIYAEPTTWTGSIGVIIPHYDLSGLLEYWKVKDDSISSKPLKQMLSPTRPRSPEEREVVTKLVNESYERFKEVVAEGRPKLKNDSELMTKATTGQVFSASQAKKLGLIDKIGYLDDALERAANLAHVKLKDVRVVEYKKPQGLFDLVTDGAASSRAAAPPGMAELLELTAPRAYYLFSWLPSLSAERQP